MSLRRFIPDLVFVLTAALALVLGWRFAEDPYLLLMHATGGGVIGDGEVSAAERASMERAVALLEARTEAGDRYAQGRLGELHAMRWWRRFDTRGFARDSLRGIQLLEAASAAGDRVATRNLAFLHTWPDRKEDRIRYLQRGAEAGDPVLQAYLAETYAYGVGVERDPRAAVHWYEQALADGEGTGAQTLRGAVHSGFIPEEAAVDALEAASGHPDYRRSRFGLFAAGLAHKWRHRRWSV